MASQFDEWLKSVVKPSHFLLVSEPCQPAEVSPIAAPAVALKKQCELSGNEGTERPQVGASAPAEPRPVALPLAPLFPSHLSAMTVVKPETVILCTAVASKPTGHWKSGSRG